MLLSCATTTRSYDATLPKVVISQASKESIKSFGTTFSDNPYIEPKTLLRGKLYEFYVLKVDFNLPDDLKVDIQSAFLDLDNKDAAKLFTQYEFVDFWENNTAIEPEKDSAKMRKITSINRSCVPSTSFIQEKGKSNLFIPYVSKYPIKRPANLNIKIFLGTGEEFSYNAILE
jgi:hypothetical protein